jgi:hypothetical protein
VTTKPRKSSATAKPAKTPPIKPPIEVTNNQSRHLVPHFEHPRLSNQYPIIEIATLAASFGSHDLEERLDSAIDMLAMIEQMEALPMATKIRNESRKRRGPSVDELPEPKLKEIEAGYRHRQKHLPQCKAILNACERDEKSGKIKRASLIAQVCKDVNGVESPNYDPDVFNEWLDTMKRKSPTGDPRTLGTNGFRYESARRVKLIPDDDAAFHLISGFRSWLRKRSTAKRPLRSKK